MFGRVTRSGRKGDGGGNAEELDEKVRRQYLAVMQYLFEHELLETLAAFESETGITHNEGSLKVSSILESSLDMFAVYSDKALDGSETAHDDEQLMQIDAGVCCTAQSPSGPSTVFEKNVIAVAWASVNFEEFVALVATADRRIHVLASDGDTLADFTELKSPVLSLDVAPLQVNSGMETLSQEVIATSMGGEVLLLRLDRPASSGSLQQQGGADWSLQLIEQYKDHSKHVAAGRFSPLADDAQLSAHFVTAARDRKANVYTRSPSGGDFTFNLTGTVQLGGEVTCCCWASPEIFVLSARDDHNLHYWNVNGGADGKPCEHMKTSMNAVPGDVVASFAVLAIAVSEDRDLIAVCTDKSRVIVLKTFTSKQLRNLYGATVDEYDVPSLCFSLDRSFLYTTSSRSISALSQQREKGESWGLSDEGGVCGEVTIFELCTGRLALRLACHEKSVRCMSRHPHTEALLTGSFDKQLKCWT